MEKIRKEWLDFLREQYPKGTRIKLNSMSDPFSPILPGTKGTVQFVDDVGTVHMKWDNGRTLGLVIGEDSFSTIPQEYSTMKLYMPLTADLFGYDEWGSPEEDGTPLNGRALLDYEDHIIAALVKNRMLEESERGLMHWYHENDSVNEKVKSVTFTAEKRDGKLWGVAECRISSMLDTEELARLKDYVTGQASDGWGEGFEQREIDVGDGNTMYVHLWNWDDWDIKTEQECFKAQEVAQGLPELCFSVLPVTGELICIKRGETGYYLSEWSTSDKEKNVELADYHNEKLGVTPSQRLAMEIGSMSGWDVPGADPSKQMGANEQQMGGMTLE